MLKGKKFDAFTLVIGDNETKDMRESDVDKKAELRPNR